jgi:hypothetical protein
VLYQSHVCAIYELRDLSQEPEGTVRGRTRFERRRGRFWERG